MKISRLFSAMFALQALATIVPAQASDAPSCKLRGGSVVQLPAAACAKEGGTLLPSDAGKAAVSEPAAVPVDAKRAAAQQVILEVLGQPMEDSGSRARVPEGVTRKLKLDGCKLTVEEMLRLDYGNLIAARKDFRIISTVDFSGIEATAYGVLGRVESKGGHLRGQALYVRERHRDGGNHIAISIAKVDDGEFSPFTLPGPGAYWEAPRNNLWMKDGYGYVEMDELGYADTGAINIIYLVRTVDDARKLKQAFDALRTACSE